MVSHALSLRRSIIQRVLFSVSYRWAQGCYETCVPPGMIFFQSLAPCSRSLAACFAAHACVRMILSTSDRNVFDLTHARACVSSGQSAGNPVALLSYGEPRILNVTSDSCQYAWDAPALWDCPRAQAFNITIQGIC